MICTRLTGRKGANSQIAIEGGPRHSMLPGICTEPQGRAEGTGRGSAGAGRRPRPPAAAPGRRERQYDTAWTALGRRLGFGDMRARTRARGQGTKTF